jgi:hypothetical protein
MAWNSPVLIYPSLFLTVGEFSGSDEIKEFLEQRLSDWERDQAAPATGPTVNNLPTEDTIPDDEANLAVAAPIEKVMFAGTSVEAVSKDGKV